MKIKDMEWVDVQFISIYTRKLNPFKEEKLYFEVYNNSKEEAEQRCIQDVRKRKGEDILITEVYSHYAGKRWIPKKTLEKLNGK